MGKEKKVKFDIVSILVIIITMVLMLFVAIRPMSIDGTTDGSRADIDRTLAKHALRVGPSDRTLQTIYIDQSVGTPSDHATTLFEGILRLNRTWFFSKGGFSGATMVMQYGLILSLGLWLIYRGFRNMSVKWPNLLLLILLPLVFMDLSYTIYMGGLRKESLVIVTMLLVFGLWTNFSCRRTMTALALLVVGFFLGIYLGHFPSTLVIIVLALVTPGGAKDRMFIPALGAAALVIVVSFIYWTWMYESPVYHKNIYNSVFHGVSHHRSGVKGVGIDPDAVSAYNVGTAADPVYKIYDTSFKNDPVLKREFYDKISYWKIMGYYFTRPGELYQEMKFVGNNSRNVSLSYANYYIGGEPLGNKLPVWGTMYSNFKRTFIPNTFWLTIVAVVALMLASRKSKDRQRMNMTALGLSALVSLFAPIILTGRAEIGHELLLYNVIFDLVIVYAVVYTIRHSINKTRSLRETYGVEQ